MRIDDAVKILRPVPDSQYRLRPCKCGSDNVAYVQYEDVEEKEQADVLVNKWRVQCFDCGNIGHGSTVRHEAQIKWNGVC